MWIRHKQINVVIVQINVLYVLEELKINVNHVIPITILGLILPLVIKYVQMVSILIPIS
jgi:hypothetical protein